MNNQDKFTTQSSKRQSKFAIDITLSCQIFYRYSLSSLVAFAFCFLLFFFFLIKNTYSDTHSTMWGWVNDKKISPAQFPETRLLLFFFKKKKFLFFSNSATRIYVNEWIAELLQSMFNDVTRGSIQVFNFHPSESICCQIPYFPIQQSKKVQHSILSLPFFRGVQHSLWCQDQVEIMKI